MLVAAGVAQLVIGAALRILPFAIVRRALAATSGGHRSKAPSVSMQSCEWAVAASGVRLGAASSCLTRMLALQWLAARRGIAVPVHIGVRRTAALEAHAWVGSPADGGGYTQIATFERKV